MKKYKESNDQIFKKVAKLIKNSLDEDYEIKNLLNDIEDEIGSDLVSIIEDALYNRKTSKKWN